MNLLNVVLLAAGQCELELAAAFWIQQEVRRTTTREENGEGGKEMCMYPVSCKHQR